MLQKARSAELGAFLAYDGHRQSISDPKERAEIRKIQKDELKHLIIVSKMLKYLDAKPDRFRDTVFTVIGNTLGFLCHYTGWLLPMHGALILEKIGVHNYFEMLEASLNEGYPELAMTLDALTRSEQAHRVYFEEKIKNGPKPKGSVDRQN